MGERRKRSVQLVAKGLTQTYGLDYEEEVLNGAAVIDHIVCELLSKSHPLTHIRHTYLGCLFIHTCMCTISLLLYGL